MFEADSVAVAVQLLLLDAHETGRVVDAAVPRVLCYLRIRVQRLRSGAVARQNSSGQPLHRPIVSVMKAAESPAGHDGTSHAKDQFTQAGTDRRPTCVLTSRDPGPVLAEAGSVPSDHCLGFHEDKDVRPSRPHPSQRHPEQSIGTSNAAPPTAVGY